MCAYVQHNGKTYQKIDQHFYLLLASKHVFIRVYIVLIFGIVNSLFYYYLARDVGEN